MTDAFDDIDVPIRAGDQNFTPITELTSATIVPFREAVWLASEHLFSTAWMEPALVASEIVAHGAAANTPSLTLDEAAAVFLLTQDSPFSVFLGDQLRSMERSAMTHSLPYLRLLYSGLSKFQSVQATVFRVVDGIIVFSAGEQVAWWQLTRCSKKLDRELSLSHQGHPQTLFIISSHSAIDISLCDAKARPDGLVLAPGSRFSVESAAQARPNLMIVHLSEIEAVVKMQ